MPIVPPCRSTTGLPFAAGSPRADVSTPGFYETSDDEFADARSEFSVITPVARSPYGSQAGGGSHKPVEGRLTLSYQPRPPIPHWVPSPPLQFAGKARGNL